MSKSTSWSALSLASLLVACGGGSASTEDGDSTDTTTTSGSDSASSGESALASPPGAWSEMSMDDRQSWMSTRVLPHMNTLFQEFDGERYSNVTCATCHGPDASAGGFAMPSNSLPALPATGTDEQHRMVSQHRPMAMFMFQRVLPDMQTLVGGEDFSEETGEGFSCFACHPHAGDEGSTLIELAEENAEPDAG